MDFEIRDERTGKVIGRRENIVAARSFERAQIRKGKRVAIWRGTAQLTFAPNHRVSSYGTNANGFGSLDSILQGTAL